MTPLQKVAATGDLRKIRAYFDGQLANAASAVRKTATELRLLEEEQARLKARIAVLEAREAAGAPPLRRVRVLDERD